jgi:hypothetical protein
MGAPTSPPPEPTPLESVEPGGPRLSVHGFLSQAYAVSSGGTYLGIPPGGTTDYRKVALQFRYQMAERDRMIVQLRHRRLGDSPTQRAIDDVDLNWAFYQHDFSESTSVKVGKVLLPTGLYSELRDVGTVLPFYRPPFGYYGEVALSLETISGLVVTHKRPIGGWTVQGEAFVGGLRDVEFLQALDTVLVNPVRSDPFLGAHFWIDTPIEGLRLGLGAFRFRGVGYQTLVFPPGDQETFVGYNASLDALFGRVTIQVEYLVVSGKQFRYPSPVIHLGYQATSKISVHAGLDRPEIQFRKDFPPLDVTLQKDYALGVNYAVRADVVIKAEGHLSKGYLLDKPQVNPYLEGPKRANYGILSVSVSF